MKQFRQSLQQVLDDFYCTLTSLDVPLQTLLQPHIDTVTRYGREGVCVCVVCVCVCYNATIVQVSPARLFNPHMEYSEH